jgi:hypothetical protein
MFVFSWEGQPPPCPAVAGYLLSTPNGLIVLELELELVLEAVYKP